jgi:hypothetical protein
MGLFLAERYLPGLATEQELVSLVERDRAAAVAMSVRHVQTIYVPADETCFTLFEAPSADLVTATCDRFGLGYRRICRALTVISPGTGESLHDHKEPQARQRDRHPSHHRHDRRAGQMILLELQVRGTSHDRSTSGDPAPGT